MGIIYETKGLTLVPFLEVDLQKSNYYDWWTDQEVTKHNSHGLFPMNREGEEAWRRKIENNEIIVWGVLIKGTDEHGYQDEFKHIGNISLQSINWINRSAEFAIVIGEKDYWGKGFASEALELLINHGFQKLNLHRIWSGTAATNKGMLRVFEKLGMVREGIFKDGVFLNGKYVDVHCYAIINWHAK